MLLPHRLWPAPNLRKSKPRLAGRPGVHDSWLGQGIKHLVQDKAAGIIPPPTEDSLFLLLNPMAALRRFPPLRRKGFPALCKEDDIQKEKLPAGSTTTALKCQELAL